VTAPTPPWDGDPLYIVGIAAAQLGIKATDPRRADLQRQVMACIEDVRDYVGFDYQDPAEAPISYVISETLVNLLTEVYTRKQAQFGIVSQYSEDGAAIRISADWLAAHCPQLHPLKRAFGLA
jgi:hypothetical protein